MIPSVYWHETLDLQPKLNVKSLLKIKANLTLQFFKTELQMQNSTITVI